MRPHGEHASLGIGYDHAVADAEEDYTAKKGGC